MCVCLCGGLEAKHREWGRLCVGSKQVACLKVLLEQSNSACICWTERWEPHPCEEQLTPSPTFQLAQYQTQGTVLAWQQSSHCITQWKQPSVRPHAGFSAHRVRSSEHDCFVVSEKFSAWQQAESKGRVREKADACHPTAHPNRPVNSTAWMEWGLNSQHTRTHMSMHENQGSRRSCRECTHSNNTGACPLFES